MRESAHYAYTEKTAGNLDSLPLNSLRERERETETETQRERQRERQRDRACKNHSVTKGQTPLVTSSKTSATPSLTAQDYVHHFRPKSTSHPNGTFHDDPLETWT